MHRPLRRAAPLPTAATLLLILTASTLASGAVAPPDPPRPPLHGIVVDAESGKPVPGAVVSLIEIERVVRVGADGSFAFSALPRGTFTLGVHAPGFAALHKELEIPLEERLIIRIAPDHHFKEEITVTASPWAISPMDSAQAADSVDVQEIKRQGHSSVAEALEKVPGVARIGTGDALGTPVIRGLTENRIRVMNDGIASNHQQFSSRHSPNVEPTLSERVEVVRGPASVMWGPDALGGVINVVHAALPSAPAGETELRGEAAAGYKGNNAEGLGRVLLEGARGGFGWRAALVHREGGDQETPRGKLDGTDYQQINGTVSVGHTGSWGRARFRWHHWEDDTGFFFPDGMPLQGFRLDLNDDLLGADLFLPVGAGDVEVAAGHQRNIRRAFPPPLGGDPGVDLELVTTTLRTGFRHRQAGPWRGRLAAEVRRVRNTPRALGELLPRYTSRALSIMGYEEGRFARSRENGFHHLILSVGARWDGSDLEVPQDLPRNLPSGFDERYRSATGSLGLVYRATRHLSFAASAGRGWRPPSAFELFANGVHGGVAALQSGNPELEEEHNLSVEASARYRGAHFKGTLTGFRSDFRDFIYLFDSGAIDAGSGLPVFEYAQTDALMEGLELSLEVVPLETLTLGLVWSAIDTENDETGNLLPQTPPDRALAYVRLATERLGPLLSPFGEVQATWNGDGEISGPDEPYGTPTESYTLLGLKVGCQFVAGSGLLGVDLVLNNLLDEEYTDFLNPYKGFRPYPDDPGRPTLNPGRDIRLLTMYQF